VLREVKVYNPRLSYLRYLPAVYQEESASKEFLERFLSVFESALYDSEETISRIHVYFDPMATPDDFVPWLASWLSLDLYELLKDKNRDFILRAIEFYKQKGTASGIAALVSFLTGTKCCVKEYMNNVFRTYGMEHYGEDEQEEIVNERGCMKFYRTMSRTVNTEDRALLADMGAYSDKVHYVTDTSKKGRYSAHVIGLFIFLPLGEKLVIKEDELHKIINSFLPVFVRAEIVIVEVPHSERYDISRIHDEYADSIHSDLGEVIEEVIGAYKDTVNWNWLYTYNGIYDGRTNDLYYRTPHSRIGVGIRI
jgi:phage tail-like protein